MLIIRMSYTTCRPIRNETRDLATHAGYGKRLGELQAQLNAICDPGVVDRAAKQAQSEKVEEFGGRDALINAGALVYTPPPGKQPELRKIT